MFVLKLCLMISFVSSTQASVYNDRAWKTFFAAMEENTEPAAKGRALLNLLKETDGQNGPQDYQGTVNYKTPSFRISSSHIKRAFATLVPMEVDGKILNWGSGGRLLKPHAADPLTMKFLTGLFTDIQQYFPGINLTLVDLFHGHLMYDNISDDYLIIFHAKEYPKDLFSFHVTKARALDPLIPLFETTSKHFARRNLIWSLNAQRIWQLDTLSNTYFKEFTKSSDESTLGNTLWEDQFGMPIFDINLITYPGLVRPVTFLY